MSRHAKKALAEKSCVPYINMSRIGKLPVTLPDGTSVEIEKRLVIVKNDKGTLTVPVPYGISVKQEENTIVVSRKSESNEHKSLHGLTRSLIANAVKGLNGGFAKELEVKGVGYRAQMSGSNLMLTVGYSHPVEFQMPEDIQIAVKGPKITVSGVDKQRVGEIAAQIRRVRPPDAYKGKGIRYVNEHIKLKPGKAAKAAGA